MLNVAMVLSYSEYYKLHHQFEVGVITVTVTRLHYTDTIPDNL